MNFFLFWLGLIIFGNNRTVQLITACYMLYLVGVIVSVFLFYADC